MRRVGVRAALVALSLLTSGAALAQDASTWREIETNHMFGFTEGSGIGLEGEKEISLDTEARIGKAGSKKLGNSRYFGSETKLEFEFTPNQYSRLNLVRF